MRLIDRLTAKLSQDGLLSTATAIAKYAFGWIRRQRKRQMRKRLYRKQSLEERFTFICDNNLWGGNESLSGEGSEVHYTENLRHWLEVAVSRYAIHSIVDAPCGDFNWMRLVLPRLAVTYHGIDIVKSVIAGNMARYGSSKVGFSVGDIRNARIPACDLLIVRDCLFHLSNRDIDQVLRNLSGVGFRFVLTSTHIVEQDFENSDIQSGDFRRIDVFRSPFGFQSVNVLEAFDDFPAGYHTKRQLVLLAKEHVPTRLTDLAEEPDSAYA